MIAILVYNILFLKIISIISIYYEFSMKIHNNILNDIKNKVCFVKIYLLYDRYKYYNFDKHNI